MGRYADTLNSRLRTRRTAEGIHHPRGASMAMWCGKCRAEMLRSNPGEVVSQARQQAAYAAHQAVCELRHMDGNRTRLAIEHGARRMLRRRAWRKAQPWVLGVLLTVLAAILIAEWF